MRPPPWRADLALALVALVWGATFVLVKNALDDISTILFLALRFTIAAIVLGLFFYARRGPGKRRGDWKGGLITGVLLYGGYALQTIGLRYTTPAKSAFITGLYIVMVPLLSAAAYHRMPRLFEWTGVAVASVGLALLTLDTATFAVNVGDLLTVGCAFVFALHILVLGQNSQRMDPDWLAFLQIGWGALIAVGTFWWMERPFVRWRPAVVGAIIVTSLLATALAFWVQTWAQQFTTATRTALIFALEPVFAWATSFIAANEVLTVRAAAGAACILAGILLVELKPIASRSHPVA
jgi:drug/metabolite transporter (DMT)-like permease